MNIDYYEPRYIRNRKDNYFDYLLGDSLQKKTLFDNVFIFDKIILLGNAGIGKSTELEELFERLWENFETNSLLPYSINLKNFRSTNNFEDIIPNDDWQTYPQVIFILDGLDEISNIEDFISAFEIFINKYKKSNYKYVLSCRTNIYDKYLVNIPDFETFYLEDLSLKQSESILKNKKGIDISTLKINESFTTYLRSPFFLEIFAEYYLSKNTIPSSHTELWDIYVNKRLEEDKNDKTKKRRFVNIAKEINSLKKVALINEFRQENFIDSTELNALFNDDYLNLIESPFILQLDQNVNRYIFEHRQLQEYFVAKALSTKSFNEILSYIKVKELDRIHPTLFNSVTFLLNLIDNEEIKTNLIDWIERHELGLIFNADSDKIDDKTKNNVFQNLFNNHCIEKKFWISTNNPIDVKKIGEFSSTNDNYTFLLQQIEANVHFRIVISAIEVLSYFGIDKLNKRNQFKTFVLDKIKSETLNPEIKSYFIYALNAQNFYEEEAILTEIFKIFGESSSKTINRALLSLLLSKGNNIDNYFEFINNEFLYEYKFKQSEDRNDIESHSKFLIEQLILLFNTPENFIEIAKYYFDDEHNIHFLSFEKDKLIQKCLEFESQDEDFILKLVKEIKFKKNYIYFNNEFINLILNLNEISKTKLIKYLLDTYDFKVISYELSKFFVENELNDLIEKIKNTNTEITEIEAFRNFLSNNNNRELGKRFNDLMINEGYTFKEPFLTNDQIEAIQLSYKNMPQANFDILFDKEELLEKIKSIFDESGNNEITKENYHFIIDKWYEKKGVWNRIGIEFNILRSLVYGTNNTLKFSDVETYFEDEDFIYENIINCLKNDKHNSLDIQQDQIQQIENWVKTKIEVLKFEKMFEVSEDDSITFYKDYEIWEITMSYIQKFELEVSDEFLLNSLELFYKRNYFEFEVKLFDYLVKKIEDKVLLKAKIISNLKKDHLIRINVVNNHILYALNNNLNEADSDIRKHLIKLDSIYQMEEIFRTYFLRYPNDTNFIEQNTLDLTKFKTWDILKILSEIRGNEKYCIDKACSYLDNFQNIDIYKQFVSKSLNILFSYNHPKAIDYYLYFVKEYGAPSVKKYVNYNYIIDDSLFSKFLNTLLLDSNFNYSLDVLYQYVSNISKEDVSYSQVKRILENTRNQLKDDERAFFQINLLIDASNNAYYVSKSKPLSFEEAKQIANKILE